MASKAVSSLSLSTATPSNNLGSAYLKGTSGAFRAGSNEVNNTYYRPTTTAVLGASKGPTQPTSQGTGYSTGYAAPSGGGGGGDTGGGQPVDPYAQIKADISSAWDTYLGGLPGLNQGIEDQNKAQQGIIDEQLAQGINTANTQKAASLRDISTNIKNAFQAGNIYLGSKGAGDSSAANQYSFALSQEAAKQGGKLNEFVNGQISNLQSQHNIAMNQLATWFADSQNKVKQMILDGQLNKAKDIEALSQNILNQALTQQQTLQANAQTRYNALLEWAANNSSNINQLKSNIAAIPQSISAPNLDSGGNIFAAPIGYGGGTTTKDQSNLFKFPTT